MISYKEYKNKVYKLFEEKYSDEFDEEEMNKYLQESEELIKKSYKENVYMLEKMNINYFDDNGIKSTICNNLYELY